MKRLILTSLEQAVSSLEKALAHPQATDAFEEELHRDAVIQRFEYTYELCWKMLKRSLEAMNGKTETDDLFSRKDLYRRAHEAGLIHDPVLWFEYHLARNKTSHTYDAQKAEEVFVVAQRFAQDARSLFEKLQTLYAAPDATA